VWFNKLESARGSAGGARGSVWVWACFEILDTVNVKRSRVGDKNDSTRIE
jgi:hypothetical protein